MKIRSAAQVLLAASNIFCSQAQLSDSPSGLRRKTQLVDYAEECTAFVEVDEDRTYKLLCGEPDGNFREIAACTHEWVAEKIDQDLIRSGQTIIYLGPNAYMNAVTKKIELPFGTFPTFYKDNAKTAHHSDNDEEVSGRRDLYQSQENKNRQLRPSVRSVLAVRVKALGGDGAVTEPMPSIAEMQNRIFDNSVNLKTIFNSCSHGALTIVKAANRSGSTTGTDIVNGVVQITVQHDVPSAPKEEVMESVINELKSEFGVANPNELADHVMLCAPVGYPETFAISNSYLSWFGGDNDACTKVSYGVHEIGHNLNLQHAGELTNPYGDQTGIMGLSYDEYEAPLMCFNPANYMQLGWFTDKSLTVNAARDLPWSGTLIGVNEYASESGMVAVLIATETNNDIYVGFNGANGINSGTREASDKVTVVKKSLEVYQGGLSSLEAKLGQGDATIVENFLNNLDLEISVNEVNAAQGTAQVSIELSGCIDHADCFDGDSTCDLCVQGKCSWDNDNCADRIQLDLLTDNYPGETSVKIIDECTQQTLFDHPLGKFTGQHTLHTNHTFGTPNSRYSITVSDSEGDGLCCNYGEGKYSVKLGGEKVIDSAYLDNDFDSETKYFGAANCGPTVSPAPTLVPTTPAPITPSPTPAPVTPPPTRLPTPNPTSAPPTTTPCIEENELCSLGTCCSSCATSGNPSSRKCLASTPAPVPTNPPAPTSTNPPVTAPPTVATTCLAVGFDCAGDVDCCSNNCKGGTCKQPK